MLFGKAVGVVAIGQQQHLHVHIFCQQHVGASHGCVYACLIAVVEQHNVLGEAPQQFYLMFAQGGARVGHHILYAALVHGYHVGIALHHIHAVFFHYGTLGLIKSVEFPLLVVYL